ncbi:MAG: hypothetical protein Q7W30_00080 [Coriobacteriia bacterium]|nr:hypothetical protein [Coriobacteriia bacterium]
MIKWASRALARDIGKVVVAIRRTVPGNNGAGMPSIAVWLGVVLAFMATVGGISRWGLVPPFDIPMLVASIGALALIFPAMSRRGPRRMWRSAQARRIELPVLAAAAVTLVAAFAADDRAVSLLGSPGSGLGALSLLVIASLALSSAWLAPQMRQALVLAAPWIVGVQVGGAASQLLLGMPMKGSLSNATYLSMVLVLFLPPLLSTVVEGHRLRTDLLSIVRLSLATGAVLVLAIGGARVGTFVAAAGLLWMLLPVLWGHGKADRRSILAGVGIGSVVLAGVVYSIPRIVTGLADGTALGSRPEMWSAAVSLIGTRPVLGWGPDGFHAAVGRVASEAMMVKEGSSGFGFAQLPTDPHQLVLAILVAVGALGLLASGWLGFAVVRTWLGERRSKGRLSWPVVSSVLFLLTAMMAPATLQNLPLFALVIGASVPLGFLRTTAVDERRTLAGSAGVAAATAIRTLSVVAAIAVMASAATHLYVGPAGESAELGSALRAQSVARLWTVDPFLYYSESVNFSVVAASGVSGAYAPAIAAAERAVALVPTDPFYRSHLGYTYFTGNETGKAAQAYSYALVLFPNSSDALEGLGYSLLAKGDAQGARRFADRALVIGPGRVTSHRLASDVYRALGDAQRAAEEAAKAEALAAP